MKYSQEGAHGIGQALCFYVLKSNGQVISHTNVQALTEDELNDPAEKLLQDKFAKSVSDAIGSFDPNLMQDIPVDDPEEPFLLTSDTEPVHDVTYGPDTIIHASIILPRGVDPSSVKPLAANETVMAYLLDGSIKTQP